MLSTHLNIYCPVKFNRLICLGLADVHGSSRGVSCTLCYKSKTCRNRYRHTSELRPESIYTQVLDKKEAYPLEVKFLWEQVWFRAYRNGLLSILWKAGRRIIPLVYATKTTLRSPDILWVKRRIVA